MTEEDIGHHEHKRRAEDKDGIRIIREIPLWGVVTLVASGVIFGAGQAISQFYAQREQEASLGRMYKLLEEVTLQLRTIQVDIKAKDIKDVQHDMGILDLQRRLDALDRNVDALQRKENK